MKHPVAALQSKRRAVGLQLLPRYPFDSSGQEET